MRQRPRLALLLAAAVLVLGGCSRSDSPESDMTPAQAEQRVLAFIDDTFAHVAPGLPQVPGTKDGSLDGSQNACTNVFEQYNGKYSDTHAREIRNVGDALLDSAEQRVTTYWQSKGLVIHRDDAVEGVVDLTTSADEIGYLFSVNRNSHILLIRGITPCLKPADRGGVP